MAISAQDVKRLREITGVGMMDCKKALEEANGDFDAAIEILRKKGQKVAAKRAEREAKEGLVVTAISSDGKKGAVAEVNCETDFVARNDEFRTFAEDVVQVVLKTNPADLDALSAEKLDSGRTIGETVTDLTGKIGEKIEVRRFEILETTDGRIVSYIHPGSRLGVLVEITGSGDLDTTGRDVAMQVAALNPVAAFREEVPQEIRDKEMEIAREAARNEGKPEAMLDRIAQGKLERYYKDNVLVEQPFVKDGSVTVREMLKSAGAEVKRYVRFALGD
jgi:elongation factor Ts